MIDFYYEFPDGLKLFNEPIKFAYLRGYHPELSPESHKFMHSQAYSNATRIWLENANGLTLVRENGRDRHARCQPREMTWIKLQARELI